MVLQAYSLDKVSDSLKKAYKLFTDGKFSNALQAFNQMLWTIPLVVVTSRKEVDEVKELLTICRSAVHTNKRILTSTLALFSPLAFQMLQAANTNMQRLLISNHTWLKFCAGSTALNGRKDEPSCGLNTLVVQCLDDGVVQTSMSVLLLSSHAYGKTCSLVAEYPSYCLLS